LAVESTILKGKAWRFGDNIDTDQIYPGQYLPITDPKEMAKHAMEGVAEDFSEKVQKGDIIVAGRNFGAGSSREHAPVAIRGAGISAVIARSFARIFYRNAVNIGLPILELEGVDRISEGDEIEVNLLTGEVHNLTTGKSLHASPVTGLEMEIMKSGGLLNYLKAHEAPNEHTNEKINERI